MVANIQSPLPVALRGNQKIQTENRTITLGPKIILPSLMPCCTKNMPHSTDVTPHNCYSVQESVCPICCTKCKTQNTDCTTYNCYSDIQSGCTNSCPVAPTVSPTIQTVHRTIAIETDSYSALPVALLH